VILEGKAGWTLGEKTRLHFSYWLSPNNSTISPYRSSYAAFGVSQSVPSVPWLYVNGGVGYNKAGVEKGLNVGTGILTNLGIGISADNNFFLEFNTFFGKMDEENYLDPNPFGANEFKFNVMLAYDFLKRKAE